MRLLALVLHLILLANHSYAATNTSSLPRDILSNYEQNGFYPVRVDPGCTGTLISPYGHILTARHCVEDEISMIGMTNSPLSPKIYAQDAKIPWEVTRQDYNSELIEKGVLLKLSFNSGLSYHDARVFSIGPGTLYPRFAFDEKTAARRKLHMQLASRGYSEGGDWVILQVSDLSKRRCRRLDLEPPKLLESVEMISFDCWKQGSEAWVVKRKGRITAYASVSSVLGDFDIFAPIGMMVTTMDAKECNSGSAFLNSRGQVSGVLSIGLRSRHGQVRTAGISVNRILQLMSAQKKSKLLKLNAACTL